MNNLNAQKIAEYLSIEEYSDNLIAVSASSDGKQQIEYFKMQARLVGADYIFFLDDNLRANNKSPFIYIYDERFKNAEEKTPIEKINKQIWTVGEIALAIVIDSDEIKIIDTRYPITEKGEANLFEIVEKIDKILKARIFEGRILEDTTDKDYDKYSPYQILLHHIEQEILKREKEVSARKGLLKNMLVKFILIKYLEEQKDNKGESVFQEGYFNQFLKEPKSEKANFCDVLREGNVVDMLNDLNKQLNGGIFRVEENEEIKAIQESNFTVVAEALDGRLDVNNQLNIWRLFDFKLLPIEFISRLYERFVVSVKGKQKKEGAYYTPPHLARLLIDELLPFDKKIDFENFRLIDPSCGSGIFLVLAYKRLITLWLLKNKKQVLEGESDIKAIQNILSNCIHGLDINSDAIAITATSLQIELASHIQPKDIWKFLKFDDLQKQGNLVGGMGFFKWYKQEEQRNKKYDIIVGNPPFNIDNKSNTDKNIDDDINNERYINYDENSKKIPNNNPALAILYISLNKLLKVDGSLFFIMPAATLHNSTAADYRKTVFSNWGVEKIYDFTGLRSCLWGRRADVATIAMLIHNTKNHNKIQHVIIRNSIINKDGAIRFEVDKYDKYNVFLEDVFSRNYIWKANLLGGGRILFYIQKYKNKQDYISIEDFLKLKQKSANWIYQDGAKSSEKEGVSLSLPMLKSKEVKSDKFNSEWLELLPKGKYRIDNENSYLPPNLLIKKNLNQNLPTIFNNKEAFIFDDTFFGIKCPKESEVVLEKFGALFRASRILYKFLITVTSSKVFLQKGSGSLINSEDIKLLPLKIDADNNPIPLGEISHIEQAVIEDTKLAVQCFGKTKGPLFELVNENEITDFSSAFCEVLNYMYQNDDYLFKETRRIVNNDFIWVTFEHTNQQNIVIQKEITTNAPVLQEILTDDISKNGLRINRIITYYGEDNKISFIKPNRLKYWTRSIAYRDAENVKADLFKNGY